MNKQADNSNIPFDEIYNKRIDDILAVVNLLDIISQTRDFRNWIKTTYNVLDDSDILAGYIFTIDIISRRLHNEVALNYSLGLTEDEAFVRADRHGTNIAKLKDNTEKVRLLKAIRRRVEPILKSSNWQETQELTDTFRNDVVLPFLELNTYAELNKSYQISSLDEAIKFTSMNEAFLFLNDTEEEVPKGYLTPTLDTHLWRSNNPKSKRYLQETFKGYKYSIQYLWSKLLSEDFSKMSLTRIHETGDWFEFDKYFDELRPIIDNIEKHLGITLGMTPVILISKSAMSVLTKLIRDKAPTESLNEFETLENLFQWYQIELIDASRGSLFNGVPALLSTIAGSVELIKRLRETPSPIQIIKLTHPEGNKRNKYSYAILMGVYGWISDASGWLLFFSCCYDFTGTGLSQLQRVDDLISEYEKEGSVKIYKHSVTEDRFLNLMEPYLLYPPRAQEPRISPKESRLKEIQETAEVRQVLQETNDMLGTARGLLLEFLGYYVFNVQENTRLEWNYKRNGIQIDLLSKTQAEIRFFECKKPLGEIVSQAKKFKSKSEDLINDNLFINEWGIESNIAKVLTLIVWNRPDPTEYTQVTQFGIDVIVVSEQLKKHRKFQGKEKDKIRHAFGE